MALAIHGNDNTMNLNHLILSNIKQSPYFRDKLMQIASVSELIDEIFYKVDHMEPWQRGTRNINNNKGMCGGVRGVGSGGVVSSSFCILYRFHTLKPTKGHLYTLINHIDSPYIRAIGFMYIRYVVEPTKLWYWYARYLNDQEPIDVRAGGGNEMNMGQLVRHFLEKIEWYDTLFPRIPIPIQKEIRDKFQEIDQEKMQSLQKEREIKEQTEKNRSRSRSSSRSRSRRKNSRKRSRSRSPPRRDDKNRSRHRR